MIASKFSPALRRVCEVTSSDNLDSSTRGKIRRHFSDGAYDKACECWEDWMEKVLTGHSIDTQSNLGMRRLKPLANSKKRLVSSSVLF